MIAPKQFYRAAGFVLACMSFNLLVRVFSELLLLRDGNVRLAAFDLIGFIGMSFGVVWGFVWAYMHVVRLKYTREQVIAELETLDFV